VLDKIKEIETRATSQINSLTSYEDIEKLRVKYLGRKAELNQLFSKISEIPPQEKGAFGKELNRVKQQIASLLEEKQTSFKSQEEKKDYTFPGEKIPFGRKHILSSMSEKICDIFQRVGFSVVEGTEIEDEWHNFTALNIPLDHPSREAFDTFYLNLKERDKALGKHLLRSHTSPSQIRVMNNAKPPMAVISPGRVYRPDKVDASHSFMFHQIEGFCVDTDINFAHLKGVLWHFVKNIFSENARLRFRPHFFPFTEPSAEVDVSCLICGGKGCSVCSQKGWLEILGCGMIHPNVLDDCGIDSKKYQGFAFGMGVERIAMLNYGINDIRLFYENDTRFLEQFYEV